MWTARVHDTRRGNTAERVIVTVEFKNSENANEDFFREYNIHVWDKATAADFKIEVDHELAMLERVTAIMKNASKLTFSPQAKERPV